MFLNMYFSSTLSDTAEFKNYFCMRLPKEWFSFGEGDYTAIALDPMKLPGEAGGFLANYLNVYIDFTAYPVKTPMSYNVLTIPVSQNGGKKYTVGISVQAEYNSYSTRRRPCMDEVTYFACRVGCRVNFIKNKCGCKPVSWQNAYSAEDNDKNIPFCGHGGPFNKTNTSALYIPYLNTPACWAAADRYDPDEECVSRCAYRCKITTYAFQRLSQIDDPSFNVTMVKLLIERFLYPVFEESLTIDKQTLLSNLGGNFSLWFGASLLGVIHVLTFVLNIVVACFLSKSAKKEESKNGIHSDTSANIEKLQLGENVPKKEAEGVKKLEEKI